MSPHRVIHDRWRLALSGLLIWAIAATIGAGVLWIAIDHSNAQFRDAQNRTTCVSRVILARLKASSEQAAKDPTVSDSTRARSRATVVFETALLNTLRTQPRSLNCDRLVGLSNQKQETP